MQTAGKKDTYLLSSDNKCQCDLEKGSWLTKAGDGSVNFPCHWRKEGAKCCEFNREYVIWRLIRAITLKLS